MGLREELEVLANKILQLGCGKVAIFPVKRAWQAADGVELANLVKQYLAKEKQQVQQFVTQDSLPKVATPLPGHSASGCTKDLTLQAIDTINSKVQSGLVPSGSPRVGDPGIMDEGDLPPDPPCPKGCKTRWECSWGGGGCSDA